MDAVLAAGFHLNCYVDDLLYVAEVTPEARRYADFQHLEIHAVGDLRKWLDRDPTKLVAVGDPAALDELEEELVPRFAGRLFISKSLPYFLEFAHPDVSKGSGLAFVAERLGFRAEETVACGDGENDRELLDWAGFGVAVANAHEDVLARADLVVPSVQEEGVAVLLEAYLDSRRRDRRPRRPQRAGRFRRRLARKGASRSVRRVARRRRGLARARPARRRAPLADEGQGQADARAARGAARRQGGAAARRAASSPRRRLRETSVGLAQVPNPPADDVPDGCDRRRRPRCARVVGEPPQLAEPEGAPSRSAASTWSARPASPAPASATGSATRPARARALPLRTRPSRGKGFITRPAAGARARGGDVRHRRLPVRRARTSTRSRRTALPVRLPQIPLASLHAGEILEAKRCRSATSPSRRASAARRAPPARTRAACSASTSSTRSSSSSLSLPEESWDEHELLLANTEELVRDARPSLPRRRAAGRRHLGGVGEDVRRRDLVPEPGSLSRDRVDLEHDRLPGSPARHPLPRRQEPSSRCTC